MFGGFLLGVITPRDHLVALRITERVEVRTRSVLPHAWIELKTNAQPLLQELIMIILLPLYFTYLGLKTDLSTIDSYQAAVSVVLIIAASMVGKIGGAAVASRILRNTWRYARRERLSAQMCVCVCEASCRALTLRPLYLWRRESFTIGFLLNTKGLVELVVLNVGLDIGVLTNQVFAIFMVMALWFVSIQLPPRDALACSHTPHAVPSNIHPTWLGTGTPSSPRRPCGCCGLDKRRRAAPRWSRGTSTRCKALKVREPPDVSDRVHRSGYSVMVCIQEARAGVSMVTVAGALAKAHAKGSTSKRKPFVKAIHLKEVSERPSTYFFAVRTCPLTTNTRHRTSRHT
jgi:hypothetical protein